MSDTAQAGGTCGLGTYKSTSTDECLTYDKMCEGKYYGETENVGIGASVQNMENSDIENAPKWE